MKPQPPHRKLLNLEIQNQTPSTTGECILAVDWGEKKCGLAWSPDGVVALPLEICPTESIEKRIQELVTQKGAKTVVMGLPVDSNLQENRICQHIRTLAQRLEKSVTVELINERFSTQSVITKGKKEPIDDLAAIKILEFFLGRG